MKMSIKKIAYLTVVLMMALFNDNLMFAQSTLTPPDPVKNVFEKFARIKAVPDISKEADHVTGANTDTVYDQAQNVLVNTLTDRTKKPRKEDEKSDESEVASEIRKHGMVNQLPLVGQQVLMHSEAIQQMYDKQMNGKINLYNAAVAQLEPSIFAAADSTRVTTALLQNNIYSSQELMWSQYMANPTLYREAMADFQECVHKATKKNAKDGTWIKSVQECGGDAVLQNPEQINYRDASASKDKAFAGRFNPYNKDSNGEGEDTDIVKVSEMLFKPLEKANIKGEDEELIKGMQDWVNMFGDYEIELKAVAAAGGSGNNFFPVRDGHVKRIKAKQEPGEKLRIMEEELYKQLIELVKHYCSTPKKSGLTEEAFKSYVQNERDKIAKHVQRLSLPEQPFTLYALNLLFEYANANLASEAEVSKKCEAIKEVKVDDKKAQADFHAIYRNYVSYVAQGHLINTWLVATNFIARRTSGLGISDEIQEYAGKLISDVTNGESLFDLKEKNINNFRAYITLLGVKLEDIRSHSRNGAGDNAKGNLSETSN